MAKGALEYGENHPKVKLKRDSKPRNIIGGPKHKDKKKRKRRA